MSKSFNTEINKRVRSAKQRELMKKMLAAGLYRSYFTKPHTAKRKANFREAVANLEKQSDRFEAINKWAY
jgi:hypothetical protein